MRDKVTIAEKLGIALAEGIATLPILALGRASVSLDKYTLAVRLLGDSASIGAPALLRYWLVGESIREAVLAAETMCKVMFHNQRRKDRQTLAAEVVRYWGDDECRGCNGLKWLPAKGAPSLSSTQCPDCRGLGKRYRPWDDVPTRPANPSQEEVERYYVDLARAKAKSRQADRLLVALDEVVRELARATDAMMR